MDLQTGVEIIAAGVTGGKEIILKILGPTASYLGDGLKTFTEKRVKNISNIFQKASEKLGEKIDDPKTSVPPKVLSTELSTLLASMLIFFNLEISSSDV